MFIYETPSKKYPFWIKICFYQPTCESFSFSGKYAQFVCIHSKKIWTGNYFPFLKSDNSTIKFFLWIADSILIFANLIILHHFVLMYTGSYGRENSERYPVWGCIQTGCAGHMTQDTSRRWSICTCRKYSSSYYKIMSHLFMFEAPSFSSTNVMAGKSVNVLYRCTLVYTLYFDIQLKDCRNLQWIW